MDRLDVRRQADHDISRQKKSNQATDLPKTGIVIVELNGTSQGTPAQAGRTVISAGTRAKNDLYGIPFLYGSCVDTKPNPSRPKRLLKSAASGAVWINIFNAACHAIYGTPNSLRPAPGLVRYRFHLV